MHCSRGKHFAHYLWRHQILCELRRLLKTFGQELGFRSRHFVILNLFNLAAQGRIMVCDFIEGLRIVIGRGGETR
jgi:hypothetical protein